MSSVKKDFCMAKTLGKIIKEFRIKKGLKKEKMALDIGITAAYLSALEYDVRKSVSPELLVKIADYLDVSTDELLGRKVKGKS